jgi:outer membrane protein assembly factor BamB
MYFVYMRSHGSLIVYGGILWWLLAPRLLFAGEWPQWGGSDARNMVSAEKGLPATFTPGKKDPKGGGVDLATTKNVRWAARLGTLTCSTPAVAGGRVFIGTAEDNKGILLCLDESTGRELWRWSAPAKELPFKAPDGGKLWFSHYPKLLGVCSTPAIDEDRVYFVTHRCEVLCLDARGRENVAKPDGKNGIPFSITSPEEAGGAKILWKFDMWDYGVRPSDATNSSVLVHDDFVYVCTSNGVDRDSDAYGHEELRKPLAPDAPNLIVLDKKTGRLAARDNAPIASRMLHGQWSSPSLGKVGDTTLIFFGGGDGFCYAFEALGPGKSMSEGAISGGLSQFSSDENGTVPLTVPFLRAKEPVKLKTVWSFDCNPAEYKVYRLFGRIDMYTHYCLGDERRQDSLNTAGDGRWVGMSEIIATPVFYKNRVYVATGRDPEHGRGRGALSCIDATKTGDISDTGKIWTYQGLDRSLSTVSIADGLLYIADVAGRVHCLDADTGRLYWIQETESEVWGSTMVADGKVYLPTRKHLWVLAAGKTTSVLADINLGAEICATPVVANGTLFIASAKYLWAVKQ